uniref:SPARC (osteonectin), cwcv and kazal like domains proteoglycan 3 n=1 Tax=Gallus gallus TaxID=9031 RepID=A0A8V0XXI7_CHICK
MLKAAALVCVCAAAWCSPALAAAAAGGRADNGNFLDDKQWLTTISQYDKEVGQWNKFRDGHKSIERRSCSRGRACDWTLLSLLHDSFMKIFKTSFRFFKYVCNTCNRIGTIIGITC